MGSLTTNVSNIKRVLLESVKKQGRNKHISDTITSK